MYVYNIYLNKGNIKGPLFNININISIFLGDVSGVSLHQGKTAKFSWGPRAFLDIKKRNSGHSIIPDLAGASLWGLSRERGGSPVASLVGWTILPSGQINIAMGKTS